MYHEYVAVTSTGLKYFDFDEVIPVETRFRCDNFNLYEYDGAFSWKDCGIYRPGSVNLRYPLYRVTASVDRFPPLDVRPFYMNGGQDDIYVNIDSKTTNGNVYCCMIGVLIG